MRRLLLVALLLMTACAGTAPAARAAAGCPPGGSPPPAGAAERQFGDLDGDGQPDTLWIADVQDAGGATTRLVGITTASGANTAVQVSSASPMPLRALAIDAQDNGGHQIIVSNGRNAHLYVLADCRLQTVVDTYYGRPFVFDLGEPRRTRHRHRLL